MTPEFSSWDLSWAVKQCLIDSGAWNPFNELVRHRVEEVELKPFLDLQSFYDISLRFREQTISVTDS